MKNKKLFAILTLVCFMFTLMPVAAFAAPVDNQVYVNGEEEATVTAGYPFQAVVGTTASGYDFFMVDEDGEGVAVSADGSFSFKTAGDYKVYALAETEAITEYINSVATPADKVATLQAAYADEIDEYDYAEVTIESPDMVYRIVFMQGDEIIEDLEIAANNGFNAGDSDNVVAVLQKAVEPEGGIDAVEEDDWSAMKGMTLTLTTVGYVDAAFVDGAVTDKNGEAEFEVTSGTAGDFQVIAKWNKTKATLPVTVNVTNTAKVSVNNEPAAPVNIDNSIQQANIEFKFTDANGAPASATVGGNVEITVVEQPADSKLKGTDFDLYHETEPTDSETDGKGVYTLVAADDAEFKEEGTYKIKVALGNGASATATVEVAEFGDVVAIQFVKAPKTVAYATAEEGVSVIGNGVVAVDANGVTDATITDVKYSVSGKAVKSFNEDGTVVMQGEEDYIGSTITVYAVYTVGGETYTTSNTLTVIDAAAGIKYLSNTAEVAVNNTLYANVVDAEGNKVVVTPAENGVKVIVLDKPENAVVVASANYTAKAGVILNLLANTAGEYKIQTIVITDDNKYISSVDTFTVGGGNATFNDVVVVSLGADSMIINNEVVKLDVAPFIENNRTMMQFNVLYVFGIDVQWVAETQSIVAEGNGIKVVMQLGSKVATVNGAEVALDVAPYSVNGRTVVPVGFITGTFGINPTFTYNADGTIADILFTK